MRVANSWGKRTANDVEVLVVAIRPQHGSASLNGFGLAWSNTSDSIEGLVTRQTIPPGIARHVDLLHIQGPIVDGDQVVEEGQVSTSLFLQALPSRSDGRHRLSKGKWTIFLALAAKDADAQYYAVDLDFDGLWWSAEQAKDHLKVAVTEAHYFGLEPDEAHRRMRSSRDRLMAPMYSVRWLDPRQWPMLRGSRRARKLYPDRIVHIARDGRITPIDDEPTGGSSDDDVA